MTGNPVCIEPNENVLEGEVASQRASFLWYCQCVHLWGNIDFSLMARRIWSVPALFGWGVPSNRVNVDLHVK